MATDDEVRRVVLAFFRQRWPNADGHSRLREDLGLDQAKISDIGEQLAAKLGKHIEPSRLADLLTVDAMVYRLQEAGDYKPPPRPQPQAR